MTIFETTKSKDMNEAEGNSNDVLYIGADVHERETQLAIFEPGGALLQEKRVPTKDLQSYVHSLPAKEKHLALESLGFVYPLYDKLKQVPGCDVTVANPKRIRQASDSKQKHDRADAKLLGNLIRTNFLKRSHMADAETREKRFLINDRVKYGLRRSELRGAIRWLLKRRGVCVGMVCWCAHTHFAKAKHGEGTISSQPSVPS